MAEIAGLKLIVPSSVAGSGVSVSASGKVTYTTATTISVNGVFDSTYDNYLVVIAEEPSTNTNTFMRLRASGSDASASNYTNQYIFANGSSVAANRPATETNFRIGNTGGGNGGMHVYLYGSALAQPTALRAVTVSSLNGAYIIEYADTHSLSTAYDGFSYYGTGGATLTGALTIYGLSQ